MADTPNPTDTVVGLLILAGIAAVAFLDIAHPATSGATPSGQTQTPPAHQPSTGNATTQPSGFDDTPYSEFQLAHEPVGYFGAQYDAAQEAAAAAWDATHQPTSCTARDWYYGTSGSCVQEIQRLLNAEIGAGLTVDGRFGGDTRQAVVFFQKSQGISADGIVGPQTWSRLLNPNPLASGGPSGTGLLLTT